MPKLNFGVHTPTETSQADEQPDSSSDFAALCDVPNAVYSCCFSKLFCCSPKLLGLSFFVAFFGHCLVRVRTRKSFSCRAQKSKSQSVQTPLHGITCVSRRNRFCFFFLLKTRLLVAMTPKGAHHIQLTPMGLQAKNAYPSSVCPFQNKYTHRQRKGRAPLPSIK